MAVPTSVLSFVKLSVCIPSFLRSSPQTPDDIASAVLGPAYPQTHDDGPSSFLATAPGHTTNISDPSHASAILHLPLQILRSPPQEDSPSQPKWIFFLLLAWACLTHTNCALKNLELELFGLFLSVTAPSSCFKQL